MQNLSKKLPIGTEFHVHIVSFRLGPIRDFFHFRPSKQRLSTNKTWCGGPDVRRKCMAIILTNSHCRLFGLTDELCFSVLCKQSE